MSKEEFFEKMEVLGLALTYDDVRLKTARSDVMPINVSLDSMFSRNVPLKIPIVSAAMDTVTEHDMGIGMALLGGLGIIHKGLTIEQQVSKVHRVKYHLNAKIDKPIIVFDGDRVSDVLQMREERGFEFHSFPVLDGNGKLVGLITRNDFDFCDNLGTRVSDIMSTDLINGDINTTMEEAYDLMIKGKKKVLPLVATDGRLCGLYVYNDIRRIKSGEFSMHNVDDNGQLRVGAAIGVGEEAIQRVSMLLEAKVDVVVIDTAHGHTSSVINTLREIKSNLGDLDVVVGNVSEPEAVEELFDAGADGIKVGQGPGSICTSRIIAGIGCPQVTAVYNCSIVAGRHMGPICADGGLKYSGDIPIAIGAGAHNVMMGSMLAGTDEAPGELVTHRGKRFKEYRGMGSLGAMRESSAARERYRQDSDKLVPEGVEGRVPYRGPLSDIMMQYLGGLRASMGYIGAKTIDELRDRADFRRISVAGQAESHPHSVEITREPPNYQGIN